MVWAVKGSGWEFNKVCSSCFWYPKPHSFEGRHPCEKPFQLIKDLVSQLSCVDGLVLDPFMGCGVVGQACISLGRRFTGFELNEKYYLEASRRLQATLA